MNELIVLIAAALKLRPGEVDESTGMAATSAWDSLAHMDLILSIEERYGISLDAEEIARMLSVAAIVEVLKSRGVELP